MLRHNTTLHWFDSWCLCLISSLVNVRLEISGTDCSCDGVKLLVASLCKLIAGTFNLSFSYLLSSGTLVIFKKHSFSLVTFVRDVSCFDIQ